MFPDTNGIYTITARRRLLPLIRWQCRLVVVAVGLWRGVLIYCKLHHTVRQNNVSKAESKRFRALVTSDNTLFFLLFSMAFSSSWCSYRSLEVCTLHYWCSYKFLVLCTLHYWCRQIVHTHTHKHILSTYLSIYLSISKTNKRLKSRYSNCRQNGIDILGTMFDVINWFSMYLF